MQRKIKIIFAAAVLLLCFAFPTYAASSGVNCPNLFVEVVLDESGTATVSEHWSLTLDDTVGSFSRRVECAEGQLLSEWELLEKKGEELLLPYTLVEEADGESMASTLALTVEEGATVAKWSFTPGTEQRDFILGYQVKNAVHCYADVADYTAVFSDADYPFELKNVSVQIQFPPNEEETVPIQAYLHGTLQNDIALSENGTLLLTGSGIPSDTALDVRALLSPQSFPGQLQEDESHIETLLAEETQKQQAAETAPKLNGLIWLVLGVGALLIVFLGWWIRRRVLKACARYVVSEEQKPFWNPPQELPPAVLPDFYYFYSAKAEDLRGKRVIGTLLDWFARGIIEITVQKDDSLLARDQVVFVRKRLLSEDAPKYELLLYDLLFKTVSGDQDRCTLSDLVRYGRQNPVEVGAALSAFDRAALRAFSAYGWVDRSLSAKKRSALVGMWVALVLALVAGVLGCVLNWRLWVLVPALLIGAALSGSCLSCRRLTKEGEEAFIQWHTYRHFLKDFSEAEELPPPALWEPTMINAAALGVLDRLLPQMETCREQVDFSEALLHFYSLWGNDGMEALLSAAAVFDAFPHERMHAHHEE